MNDVEDTEQSLGRLHDAPRGRLRMTVPMSFGLLRVAPLFASFCSRYPEVELDVTFNDRVVDLVEEEFDLAVRIGARLDDSSMSVRKLAAGKRLLCASPAYLREHGSPKHPSELVHHACLRYTLHASPGVWELTGPDGPVVVRTRGPLQVNNSIAIREALLGGLGIALVPDFIVHKDIQAGSLQAVLEEFVPSGYGVFAVSPATQYVPPKTRALIGFLKEGLKANAHPVSTPTHKQSHES